MFCKLLLISWIVSLNVSFAFDSFPIKIANENSLKRHKLHSEKACENDLNMFNDAFEKREVWALKLFDTWSKITSEKFSEGSADFGKFKYCINYKHFTKPTVADHLIQGQYCLVNFMNIRNTTTISNVDNIKYFWPNRFQIGDFVKNWGFPITKAVCLPASCNNPAEILEFVNKFLIKSELHGFGITCQTNDPVPLKVIDIIAIVIYSIFVLLLLSSTIYDILMKHKSKEPNKLLIAFSIYTNGKQLFDTTPSKSSNSIECLHGLRALSVMWIIFGHRFGNQQGFPLTNLIETLEHFSRFYSSVFTAYHLAVDTFFVMGALLVTRSTLVALDRKSLNVWRMFYHRYLRYTPAYAALILWNISLAKFTYNGPMVVDGMSSNCEKYWWSSLLHIQNYVNPNQLCLGHGWYLSVDFQLFVLSPFLIYPAWRWGRRYIWSLGLLALASSIYILIISLVMEIHMSFRIPGEINIYYDWIYYPTHTRMGPWLVGILLGYILHKIRHESVKISKTVDSILWIIAISIMITIVVIMQPLNQPLSNETSLAFNSFSIALHRLLWAIAIAWIIFACHKNKSGGIVRWFLSLPQWQPIGRMGLSIYLVHLVYQLTILVNQKQAFYFDIWSVFQAYWGDVFASTVLGSLIYFSFEAPFILISSYFNHRPQIKG